MLGGAPPGGAWKSGRKILLPNGHRVAARFGRSGVPNKIFLPVIFLPKLERRR
jgi:hypothetical protein